MTVQLFLGDCLEILPTLAASDDYVLIADPPYGVNLGNHKASTDLREKHLNKVGYNDYEDTPENYLKVVVPAIRMALAMTKRGMVFGVPPNIWKLPPPDTIGGIFSPAGVGRTRWGFTTFMTLLLYGSAPDLNLGGRPAAIQSTAHAEDTGHPVTKPLPWMTWAVSLGSRLGETVIDPFMGSGTTGVAAVKLGRNFIGIEKDPAYFAIAQKRIAQAEAQPALLQI